MFVWSGEVVVRFGWVDGMEGERGKTSRALHGSTHTDRPQTCMCVCACIAAHIHTTSHTNTHTKLQTYAYVYQKQCVCWRITYRVSVAASRSLIRACCCGFRHLIDSMAGFCKEGREGGERV